MKVYRMLNLGLAVCLAVACGAVQVAPLAPIGPVPLVAMEHPPAAHDSAQALLWFRHRNTPPSP